MSATDRVLYCSGQEGSIDQVFYRWVLAEDLIQVIPVGGHKTVVRRFVDPSPDDAPVQRGLAAGVVDRDAYPEGVLQRQGELVEVLPYFEVESYLCHPDLLLPALASRGRPMDPETLLEHTVSSARATFVPAINAHLTHQPKPSGRRRLELMAAQYADQLRLADDILKKGNVESLLRYFPGRRLATRMARILDFTNAQDILSAIVALPELRETQPVATLREALLLRFRA